MIRTSLFAIALMSVAGGAMALATSQGSGALLRGLDKVSGQSEDITVPTGGQAKFGNITVKMSECRYPQGSISSEAYAHLTIVDERTPDPLFDGWMIASSPALSAMDHPRYDVWVIHCTKD